MAALIDVFGEGNKGRWVLKEYEERRRTHEYIDNDGKEVTREIGDWDRDVVSRGNGRNIVDIFWLRHTMTNEVAPFDGETAHVAMGLATPELAQQAARNYLAATAKAAELAPEFTPDIEQLIKSIAVNSGRGEALTRELYRKVLLEKGQLVATNMLLLTDANYPQKTPAANQMTEASIPMSLDTAFGDGGEEGQARLLEEIERIERDFPALQTYLDREFAIIAGFYVDVDGALGERARKAVDVRDGVTERQELLASRNGDLQGLELGDESGNQFVILTPDASDPGKVRMTQFDQSGFVGHFSLQNYELLLAAAYKDGYRIDASGKLAELSQTERFVTGNSMAAQIQAVNAGQMSLADALAGKSVPSATTSMQSQQFARYAKWVSDGNEVSIGMIEQIKADERLRDGEADELLRSIGAATAMTAATDSSRESWGQIEARSTWGRLTNGSKTFWYSEPGNDRRMSYGQVIDTRKTEGRSANALDAWETSDGSRHETMNKAMAHEIETTTKPRLIRDGYLAAVAAAPTTAPLVALDAAPAAPSSTPISRNTMPWEGMATVDSYRWAGTKLQLEAHDRKGAEIGLVREGEAELVVVLRGGRTLEVEFSGERKVRVRLSSEDFTFKMVELVDAESGVDIAINEMSTAEVESDTRSRPAPGAFQHGNSSSRDGQMLLANRGSSIAALKLLNSVVASLDPNIAYTEAELENAAVDNLPLLQDWLSAEAVRLQSIEIKPKNQWDNLCAVGDISARLSDESFIEDVPADWIIMNAPRPLLGHVIIDNGPFISGRFFAGIDPSCSLATPYIANNKSMNACVVIRATKEEQVDLALVGHMYADKYRTKYSGDRLYETLNPQSKLHGKTVNELIALREQSRDQQANTKQVIDAGPPSSTAPAVTQDDLQRFVIAAIKDKVAHEGSTPLERLLVQEGACTDVAIANLLESHPLYDVGTSAAVFDSVDFNAIRSEVTRIGEMTERFLERFLARGKTGSKGTEGAPAAPAAKLEVVPVTSPATVKPEEDRVEVKLLAGAALGAEFKRQIAEGVAALSMGVVEDGVEYPVVVSINGRSERFAVRQHGDDARLDMLALRASPEGNCFVTYHFADGDSLVEARRIAVSSMTAPEAEVRQFEMLFEGLDELLGYLIDTGPVSAPSYKMPKMG